MSHKTFMTHLFHTMKLYYDFTDTLKVDNIGILGEELIIKFSRNNFIHECLVMKMTKNR